MKPTGARRLTAAVFLGGLLLYTATLAPSVVFGDPAEYTFVPYAWGILHPPGYAFQTLLVKLWQTVVPLGTVAWRTNLLSAAAGAAAAALVFGVAGSLADRRAGAGWQVTRRGPALFGAAALAVSADFWQHAIHANAHIVTAALAALALFCLLRWRAAQDDRWLRGCALVAGLSVTHHPLLVFSFPAYAAFVLVNLKWPLDAKQWKRLLALLPWAALGLTPWLYFPIRSAVGPPPIIGPHDLNTLDGFLNLALARGLRVNLFHFGLGEQWQRVIVFWELLRLQMPLAAAALIPLGLIRLWRRDWPAGLLLTLFLGFNLAFTLNTVQDVLAYFLVPLAGLAALAGVGARAVLDWRGWREIQSPNRHLPITNLIALALFIIPLSVLVHNAPRLSLRQYRAADDYVDGLFARFAGRGEHAILLSDWEHLTPLWYRQHVEGQAFTPADLTPVFVSGGERPWVDAVWGHIEAGPIYVIEYQPQIAAEGFRLRAEGSLYRVLPPPAVEMPAIPNPLGATAGGQIEILGYDLATTEARAGEAIPFILYMRVPQAVGEILFPYAAVGPYRSEWTTDSHLLTPSWQAGEVIAERFDLTIPLAAPAGEYPLRLGMSNLNSGEQIPLANLQSLNSTPPAPTLQLATLNVLGNPAAPSAQTLAGLKANFGQQAGLEGAQVWAGGRLYSAPWPEPIPARPGQAIQLFLGWRALAPSQASATVFAHLLDAGNGVWAGQDYTPLGGAFPTLLWFPKWFEGQRVLDPYTITVPPEAPPGDYYLEVGLYGLRTIQRLPAFDAAGNLAGDRFVLGGVRVEAPPSGLSPTYP